MFTYPFAYTPHPLCLEAAEKLKEHVREIAPEMFAGQGEGKMFGVLIAKDEDDRFVTLYAYSGNWTKGDDFFVPSVYELPPHSIPTDSEASRELQLHLFHQYHLLNAKGESRDIIEIFEDFYDNNTDESHRHRYCHRQFIPPAGTGDCCAPKLLQYAYAHRLHPEHMGEFWLGESPRGVIREHGKWYPACQSKCRPLLHWMLQGLDVEPHPLQQKMIDAAKNLRIIYEDDYLIVVYKPEGMLSVPGNIPAPSVESVMQERSQSTTLPMIVHRLDMDTSGLLLLAKSKEVYKELQTQFFKREIKKTYVAILSSSLSSLDSRLSSFIKGKITLPLSREPHHRHRQMVNHEHGKEAITEYEIIRCFEVDGEQRAKVKFHPLTGRTHQLRLHAASPEGLGAPILGDRLYGTPSDRLYLQAQKIEFRHPVTGEPMSFELPEEF